MFQWMEILAPGLVAQAVLALSIVAAVGLALGSIGFRGIRLGAAGVLFAGIFFGQLGMHLDERILEFVRDFGPPSLAAAQAVLQGFKGQSSDNTDLLPTSDRIRCGLPVGNDSPGIRRPDSYFDPSLTPQKSRALRSGAHIAD
jgi:hypothetical protein